MNKIKQLKSIQNMIRSKDLETVNLGLNMFISLSQTENIPVDSVKHAIKVLSDLRCCCTSLEDMCPLSLLDFNYKLGLYINNIEYERKTNNK